MADALSPLRVMDQSVPVGPQLLRVLRNMIIHNDWAPGARLSEAEVAKAFGVSRQPVREAFIKLAEEGLLEIRPQRGTFVRKISKTAVMDARFVREAIEANITRELAATGDAGLVARLRKLLVAQEAVPQGEIYDFIR